jgi:hypothetical protein
MLSKATTAGEIYGYYLGHGVLWGPGVGLAYSIGLVLVLGGGEPTDIEWAIAMVMGPLMGLVYGLGAALVAGTVAMGARSSATEGEQVAWPGVAGFAAAIGVLFGLAFGTGSVEGVWGVLLPSLIAAVAVALATRRLALRP